VTDRSVEMDAMAGRTGTEDRVAGTVVSVNVGRPRQIGGGNHRRTRSAIGKQPVTGPVRVEGVNLAGDDQADRRVHGGTWKAVYAYASEDYHWWSEQLGRQLAPATFGENLTVQGVDLHDCAVGDTWTVGAAQLRVTEPRTPCFKLGITMGDDEFVARFADARRFGAYFTIDQPGDVAAGDLMQLVDRPTAPLTIAEFITAIEDGDHDLLTRLADNQWASPAWRRRAARAAERSR
jgi:MOSC domain-containing protein YiiM